MKNICFINGSLRGEKASSLEFLRDIDRKFTGSEYKKSFITVTAALKESYPEDRLKCIADADVLILVFPLYTYGLPGALMRLLEDYYRYLKAGNDYTRSRVYIIVNCAFPRPDVTTGEAVRVIRNFCRRLSLNWRFAVCIGTGPVVVATKKVPFLYPKLKRAYTEIVQDTNTGGSDEKGSFFIKPVIPESVIAWIKHYYEKKGNMIDRKTDR